MDTSETYIKMCEKAEEIQKLWKYSAIHDVYGRVRLGIVYFVNDVLFQDVEYKEGEISPVKRRIVWLPRQDQLQEMLKVYEADSLTLQYNFMEWCIPYFCSKSKYIYPWYKISATSMEQLWLAFVMKELYHKVWYKENWVEYHSGDVGSKRAKVRDCRANDNSL